MYIHDENELTTAECVFFIEKKHILQLSLFFRTNTHSAVVEALNYYTRLQLGVGTRRE